MNTACRGKQHESYLHILVHVFNHHGRRCGLGKVEAVKVLQLNLCTKMPGHSRKERLLKVRQYIEDNNVHVCLFCEGLSICPPFYSTPELLRSWEALYHRPYIGVPWFYTFRVGILSAYNIIKTDSLYCEVPQTEWLDRLPLPGRRRAVAVWVDVPDIGIMALVSLHLTSSPKSQSNRMAQFAFVSNWCAGMECDALVIGGDWNADSSNPAFPLFTEPHGQAPDYVCVSGNAKVDKVYPVLTDGTVTDHAGGIIVEISRTDN